MDELIQQVLPYHHRGYGVEAKMTVITRFRAEHQISEVKEKHVRVCVYG